MRHAPLVQEKASSKFSYLLLLDRRSKRQFWDRRHPKLRWRHRWVFHLLSVLRANWTARMSRHSRWHLRPEKDRELGLNSIIIISFMCQNKHIITEFPVISPPHVPTRLRECNVTIVDIFNLSAGVLFLLYFRVAYSFSWDLSAYLSYSCQIAREKNPSPKKYSFAPLSDEITLVIPRRVTM